jgi:hypothetical protein
MVASRESKSQSRSVLPQHLAKLQSSGLTDETIAAAGLRSESNPAKVSAILGWPAKKLGPCLVFPARNADGSLNLNGKARLRPDRPRKNAKGKPIKYEQPKGAVNWLYYPPGTTAVLADATKPLVFTEGDLKALRSDQDGQPAVSVPGVYGWQKKRARDAAGKPTGPRLLIPDFDAIALRGRTAYVAFDSDAATNTSVLLAEWHLAQALQGRGATVLVVRIPPGPNAAKVGLDDYLVQNGSASLSGLLASATPPTRPTATTVSGSTGPTSLSNYVVQVIDKQEVKVGLAAASVASHLFTLTQGWPKRVGPQLFAVADNAPLYLDCPTDLFAWINGQVGDGKRSGVRWVSNSEDKVSKPEFFAHLQQTAEPYQAVEGFPHWPALPGHYYVHPPLGGGNGSALEELLDCFEPATPIDRDLILGFLLTLVAGLPPGSRPAWLFTAEDGDDRQGRGVGKSKLVELCSRLVGGCLSIDSGEDIGVVKTRLLSLEGRSRRVLLADNVKSLRLSWDGLEALITTDTISGKGLYIGEGRNPNTLTTAITLNGATLSKDMAQRCVIVTLKRPAYDGDWFDRTAALVDSRRWHILGDLVAMLKRPASPLKRYTRWSSWERLVLARLPDPLDAQRLIEHRQDDVDDDEDERDLVRDSIRNDLIRRGHTPDQQVILIPTAMMASIVNNATNQRHRPVNQTSAHVKTLGIPELRKSDRAKHRAWVWTGCQATAGATSVLINGDIVPG